MLERLNESLDHLEQHLDEEVVVEVLARIAATSEYHYRRMFSVLAGMPLGEYVRRRRLTVAAAEVASGERSLLDVAQRAGYGSGEAFARAFRALHGIAPSEARQAGAVLRAQPRISFRLVVEGSSVMEYRIVQSEAFQIVGRHARVPVVYEGMNPALVAFIRGLGAEQIARIGALSDREPAGVLGVTSALAEDRAEGSEFDYYHGAARIAPVPTGDTWDVLPVEAGTWVVFTSSGEFPQAIQYLWRDVYTQWFPSNPYRSRRGPELLRTVLSGDGTHADAELWIPVERAAD
ncbi:MAG: AraC family transcriptional regulator [Dehalococcoidia bacterium]